MSCQFCNEDVDLAKAKQDAKKFVQESGKAAVVYLAGNEFKYMEAQAFFDRPEGRIIDCVSFV